MNVRIAFCSLLLFALILIGCTGSSPRFRSGDDRANTERTKNSSPRFSSREAEEERKEDDRKPDPAEIEKITSGSRDFRKEKNTSISPLNQSKMMREISKYMGTKYVIGGEDQRGIDCSGYVLAVYGTALGKQLPRTSAEQAHVGMSIPVEDLKFGDLVFFNTSGERYSHVGIYLGDDLFAHASVSLGVTISSLESSYYKKRLEGARRIIY
ncbi:MAG: hypothetical protein FJ215_06735 [Ignavibacteria bacterium]|nr:hypothetical protein [Ignavibacteria bacterium]